jgi:hypothetical protein
MYPSQPHLRPHHVSVRTMLDAAGITYSEEEGSPSSFHFYVPALNGQLSVAIRVVPEAGEVIAYCGLPMRIEPLLLNSAREAVAWINTGLRRSCFELDQDRFQVICRTCLWTGEDAPSREALGELLRCNVDTANHYHRAFLDIMREGRMVRDAVASCQQRAGFDIS